MVFSMMSSNLTHYDANWRFQMQYDALNNVKILTEGGDLTVTNNDDNATLEKRRIVYDDGFDPQRNEICQDCPSDWCSV